MAGIQETTKLNENELKDLAAKIHKFESSLDPAQANAYHSAMKNAVEDPLASMFGDPSKRQELSDYLKHKAGVDPASVEAQPGSITSVIVTVAVHC